MTSRRRRRLFRLRVRWGAGVTVAALLVAAAITVLVLVRVGTLDFLPWAYAGLVLAAVAALSAVAMTIAEAHAEDDVER
jgi:cobalamin biosynthesis protein CobD/CbiB